ncbi:MAG TPA: hypothetical protein VFJ16_27835 [Longimicrobium sp.]|nr:hypothetical protein [Longimicrobium sp.]
MRGRHGLTSLKSLCPKHAYTISKKKDTRWWEVRDPENELMCLTVYRKGAREVVRRLAA